MGTRFLVIFTFLYFQTFGTSIITASLNVTCTERERQSLLVFKQSLTHTNNLLSTWNGIECCEWHGVGCDSRNGHVVKLDLRPPLSSETFTFSDKSTLEGSGFGGVVPHHLGNLSRLQYLDLRTSFVLDNIYDPQSSPTYVFFSEFILDDMGWVSSLSSLRHLDLSGITIGEHIDWFHSVNMLPSLLTLNLAQSNINIPSNRFVNFTSLNWLDLSFNLINSSIPIWLSNLTGLTHLSLKYNHFHGKIPDFLGMFSALASIDFSSNYFDTSLPDLLFNLSSIVHLDLSVNKFSGPIPKSLGLLFKLEDLYLNYNRLSGNIPITLGQLSNLKNLNICQNSLVGVLSETHFAKLKNLNSLDLSLNSLALNISSQWIAPFQLQILLAPSINTGPQFPNWLQTQTNLKRLDISNSSIKDTIPKWFENILSHMFHLDLSNNQIGGKLPRFPGDSSNQIRNRIIKMNSNTFEGSLATFPKNVRVLDLSDNLLSGNVPQTNGKMNPRLEVVNLSRNRFTGNIPVHLCKVPSIRVLDLSQNKFYGRLPRCLGNLINLQAMDFADNALTGVLPSSLGSLTQLRSLHLYNNRFEGNLPLSLQNLTRLVTMDIGDNFLVGSIPFWIGENLSSLRILNLQSNKFTGKIPSQLCRLTTVQNLNLAQNNIIGTIPHCFSNLSGMITNQVNLGYYVDYYEENIKASLKGIQLVYTKTIQFLTTLDLSSNNITGEIPDVLMNLVGLKNLNLSRNQLDGQVPTNIGNLNHMESLDLSMNMLSGRIPQSLSSLNFLSYLNLSFNNLSGVIPVGDQLQTLVDPSIYEGNDELCGPPGPRSCKGNYSSYNHVGEDEGQDEEEGLWFYSGMGWGFVAGFTGFVGSLYFIRTWSLSYFTILENIYGGLTILILLNLARLRRKFF